METTLARLERGLVRGVVGGFFAGAIFLLGNMWYADSQGLPAVAPLLDISTIFYFADKPVESPENFSVGLVIHMTLSMAFGVAFALIAPLLRNTRALVAGGVGFGLALYVVNFQILGRLFFEWFLEGPDQGFEVFIHAIFGLLLVPFFVSEIRAEPAAARQTEAQPARAGDTA